MRSLFHIAYLFLLFAGCQKGTPLIPPEEPPILRGVPGWAFALSNGDTLFADSAVVSVDGKNSGVTDDRGMFILDSLVAGSHTIAIRHDAFQAYARDTVFASSNARMVFSLTPVLADFLPLAVGARWQYAYSSFATVVIPLVSDTTYVGTLEWKITGVSMQNGTPVYSVREVIEGDGVYAHHLLPDLSHASHVGPDTSHFTITDNSPGTVSLGPSAAGIGAHIARYRWAALDTVRFRNFEHYDPEYVTLQQGTGLIAWEKSHSSNHYSYARMRLVSR